MFLWRDAHVPSYVPHLRERWGAIFQSSDFLNTPERLSSSQAFRPMYIKSSRLKNIVKFDFKPGLCYTLLTSNIRRDRPKACPDSMEGKLIGSFFKFFLIINGKNISHSKVEKEAEVQVARCSPLLPLRAQKRIYA